MLKRDVHVWSTLAALFGSIPHRRTFTEGTVADIRTGDRLWNGALIGAAIATRLAIWDYLIDSSEPGNASVLAAALALGPAAGEDRTHW